MTDALKPDLETLERIADLIPQIPDAEWNMAKWQNKIYNAECKTTGCAIGQAVMHGLLPQLELRIVADYTDNAGHRIENYDVCIIGVPYTSDNSAFRAVAKVLGMELHEATTLFYPRYDPDDDYDTEEERKEAEFADTKQGVEQRIREFIEEWRVEAQ